MTAPDPPTPPTPSGSASGKTDSQLARRAGESLQVEERRQLVLERTYGFLARTNRWPTWDELDDALDRGADIDDPWAAVSSLDRSLFFGVGDFEPSDTQTVGLTVAGLRKVGAATEDLRILADTIIWAVKTAHSAPIGTATIMIDTDVIIKHVAVPAAGRSDLLQRQHALWTGLGRLTTGASGAAEMGNWNVHLARKQLRPLRRATNANDLVDMLAAPPTTPTAQASIGPTGTLAADSPTSATASELPPTSESSVSVKIVVGENGVAYQVDFSTVLGSGTQGRVVAGTDPDGAAVAVKVVEVRTGAGTDPWMRDARAAMREAVVGAYLDATGIDAVVPLLTQFLDEGRLLLFFPRAEQSLADVIATRQSDINTGPTLSGIEVRRIAIQLTRALMQLHDRGVMHRDIKPSNALFWNGSWRWADLGIARMLSHQTDTITFVGMGTRVYTAPEVIAGTAQTIRSDVYSLGCTLYELATSRVPFPTNTAIRHITDMPDFDAVTDPVLARALTYALSKAHDSRVTAEQFLDMLVGASASSAELDGLRALAVRGRRHQDELATQAERAAQRSAASQDAMSQLRRIWDTFIETARTIDPDARGRHEDESRSVLRLHDVGLYVLYTPPSDGTCPATAVGQISFQRVDHKSVLIANVYAKPEDADDGVSQWRLIQLQPNSIRINKAVQERPRPAVSLDELEAWLAKRAANRPGPPDFLVVADDELTVQSLTNLLVAEAESTA